MASSFQSGYQYSNVPVAEASRVEQNIPPISQNQQQQKQQQEHSQYSRRSATDGSWIGVGRIGMDVPDWMLSVCGSPERRRRLGICLVVGLLLAVVAHRGNDNAPPPPPSPLNDHHSKIGKVFSKVPGGNNNNAPPPLPKAKGVAGGNPVPLPPDDDDDPRVQGKGKPLPPPPPPSGKKGKANGVPLPLPPNADPNGKPQTLTYLLAYPQSGATYTVRLLETALSINTATNHADVPPPPPPIIKSKSKQIKPKPPPAPTRIDPSNTASPYWHAANRTHAFPLRRTLTLTHCDGYHADDTVPLPEWTFERGCRTVRDEDDKKDRTNIGVLPRSYWDPVKRTVHLIRDPFSNVVSRSHAWRQTKEGVAFNEYLLFHSKGKIDKKRFNSYCQEMDAQDMGGFVDPGDEELNAILKNVPCRLEFLRYLHWHMLANRMKHRSGSIQFGDQIIGDKSTTPAAAFATSEEPSGSLAVYYEAFLSDVKTDEVLAVTAAFLELEEVDFTGRPAGFGIVRVYRDYYTAEQQKAVEQLFRVVLAHDFETWNLLKHYFD